MALTVSITDPSRVTTLPTAQTLVAVPDNGVDPIPPEIVYGWSQVSGPAAVAFSAPAAATTAVTFMVPGIYALRVTVTADVAYATADARIVVITAGGDQGVVWRDPATLDGEPDPEADLTYAWTMVSGPGTVLFTDATDPGSTATFSAKGTYVLRLTVTDPVPAPDEVGSDTVTITVADPVLPPMRRLRAAPHVSNENRRLVHDRFELEFEAGLGLATGQGSDPQLMLRWSNNGGQTWGHEHWRSAGAQGVYKRRARWLRLGFARDRVYELSVSDPIPWRVLGAWLEVKGGAS